MLPACLLFLALFSPSIMSISVKRNSKTVLFGKSKPWNINEWKEDKDSGSTGQLSYMPGPLSKPTDGIMMAGKLAPNTAKAHYGQRYFKDGLLTVAPNGVGFSVIVDPRRNANTIQNFTLEVSNHHSQTFQASLSVVLDVIEFKTYPYSIDVPFASFVASGTTRHDSHQFNPSEISQLAFYFRGPVPENRNSFDLMVKEISVYS